MIEFLSIVLVITGVLQVILFFKIWIMTNDVKIIKESLDIEPEIKEDQLIVEAQIKALNGDKEAFDLYLKAFHRDVVALYNTLSRQYGDVEIFNPRDEQYAIEYSQIVNYFSKRIEKLGMKLPSTEKYDSFQKINAIISKI